MSDKDTNVKGDTRVRPYRAGDLPALMELFRASVHRVARRDYTPRQLAAWAPPDLDQTAWSKRLDRNHSLVAEARAGPVGFAELTEGGHLDMLFVAPDRQGRGIARALLRAIEAEAAHRGLRRLTTDASRTARPFFLKAGFRLIEARDVERRGVTLENFRMEQEAGKSV